MGNLYKGVDYLRSYKAMIFDLDDTLLDRNKAVDNMFLSILDKCYEGVKGSAKNDMLKGSKNMIIEAMAMVIKLKFWNHFLMNIHPNIDCHAVTFKIFGIILSLIVFL